MRRSAPVLLQRAVQIGDRLAVVGEQDRSHPNSSSALDVGNNVVNKHGLFGQHAESLAYQAVDPRIRLEIPDLMRVHDDVTHLRKAMCPLFALTGADEAVAENARLVPRTETPKVVGEFPVEASDVLVPSVVHQRGDPRGVEIQYVRCATLDFVKRRGPDRTGTPDHVQQTLELGRREFHPRGPTAPPARAGVALQASADIEDHRLDRHVGIMPGARDHRRLAPAESATLSEHPTWRALRSPCPRRYGEHLRAAATTAPVLVQGSGRHWARNAAGRARFPQ